MAAPAYLTLSEQVAEMRATYPQLRLTMQASWGVAWQGPLVGFSRRYEMGVSMIQGLSIGDFDLTNYGPEVRVLSPDLIAECSGGRLPHVYPSRTYPKLCLYDPEADDWNREMALAHSIVPWAAQWLGCYEMWRVTGRWTGAERHPETAATAKVGGSPSCGSRTPQPSQFARVSRWLGTEASRPVLGAAARQSVPSLARDWWRTDRACRRFTDTFSKGDGS